MGPLIDESNILEYVDEYTLYCNYLGFEADINTDYTSPLREGDENPSFTIFPSKKVPNREFLWKDKGGGGISGDIIRLVQLMYGYLTKWEAVARIKSDFGLGGFMGTPQKIVRNAPPVYSNTCADIRVRPKFFTKKDLEWWAKFNISEEILKLYRVSSLYCFWMTPSQKCPMFPSSVGYIYRIYDRYQLYFPLAAKGHKFRNDLSEKHVMGMEQLQFNSDLLIITKSYKDVMCLRSFGYEAVSPRSENVRMPAEFFPWAEKRYKRILILFDNDMKHRGDWYPYPKVYVPVETGAKDISDFTCNYSPAAAKELLQTIFK